MNHGAILERHKLRPSGLCTEIVLFLRRIRWNGSVALVNATLSILILPRKGYVNSPRKDGGYQDHYKWNKA